MAISDATKKRPLLTLYLLKKSYLGLTFKFSVKRVLCPLGHIFNEIKRDIQFGHRIGLVHDQYEIWYFRYSQISNENRSNNKQNLEHFKLKNWTFFSHKFFNNSKMLLSSSWAIFIRVLVFSSSPRANLSSLKYLCFPFLLVFQFILI